MNEHQTQAATGGVGYNPNIASPGTNSPLLRGNGADRDGFGMSGQSEQDLHARSAHETMRAGQHDHRPSARRAPEWYEDTNTLSAAAMGIAGGVFFGWLLARWGDSDRSRNWEDESWAEPRYVPERRYSRESFAGQSSSRSSRSLATDETRDLIASDKVEGTAVYDRKGERLGSVYNFMVGKRSGQVAYAVMSFGGWLGMGESYHPLPWHTLTYDTDLGGYVVGLTKDRLRNAPSHKAGEGSPSDTTYWRHVKDHWG